MLVKKEEELQKKKDIFQQCFNLILLGFILDVSIGR